MLRNLSIIIPTLNSELVLEKCLKSIAVQKYPKSKIEIIISDGGSVDSTIKIASKFKTRVVFNRLKTAESGKAVGVRAAKGEYIFLIDSDNILPNSRWLLKMVKPFMDSEITASEPIRYTYRKSDPTLTRYFALLGMNDPICLFIGNYDRFSYVTNKWTDLNFKTIKKKGYIKISLDREPIPTVGANGVVYRSPYLKAAVGNSSFLFDIDILLKSIRTIGVVKIAKVNTGIVHTFVENNISKFYRKQLRRINDMSFHKSKKNRDTDWERLFLPGIMYFILCCIFIVPIFYQAIKGYLRKPDIAWLYHPLICYSTLFIYIYGWIRGKISPAESSRLQWKQ